MLTCVSECFDESWDVTLVNLMIRVAAVLLCVLSDAMCRQNTKGKAIGYDVWSVHVGCQIVSACLRFDRSLGLLG